jgi:acyl-CoA hydrolase
VTVSIDNVEFRQPVEVGQLVSMHASVTYVGRTSLVVGIRVTAEHVETGEVRHTNTSYFTMVAKDKEGAPRVVPPLLLESPEDARRFMEAMRRRTLKMHYKDDFDNEKTRLQTETNLAMLSSERCVVGF